MYSGEIKSRSAFFEPEHVTIRRQIKVEALTQSVVLSLPANACLLGNAYFVNKPGRPSATVLVGFEEGEDDIATASLSSNSTVVVPLNPDISNETRSIYVDFSGGTNAEIGLVIEYTEVPRERNIT